MSGTVGSVIMDPLFVIGVHAIKNVCNAVPRNHRETRYHALLLVDFRQGVRYPLVKYVRIPYIGEGEV